MDKRFKILAVDDDATNVLAITLALKGEYDIFSALDGHDAISLMKEHQPDLILLDVMMPGLSGFDVCAVIKSDVRYADIPVIFLTELDTSEGELRGLELGGIDYITKPINYALLKQRVRNHIQLKERTDQVKEQRDLLARQKEALEASLARVKQLEGIIPICSYCKKIRDDQQSWHQLERYISDHSEAMFSHGACPECLAKEIENIDKG